MKIFLYSVVLSLMCLITPVQAAEEGIAVIVNDGVITYSDIKSRLRLIMQSSGMPNTVEMRQKITPQITSMLIEEQLKLQEANDLGIEVTETQIQEGLERISEQNNIPVAQFIGMLESAGINPETLHDQIRAEIAWGTVVAKKVRPQIDVTDTDVDVELAQLKKNIGTAQYLLSEIFLHVDVPARESSVQQTAEKIYQQLKVEPHAFSAIARQFSQSAGASQGGDIGWVETGQSAEAIEDMLLKMSKGSISAPIRTVNGYHILLLRNKRALTKEALPNREEILSKIGNQRLGRRAKSYLLDLKANAFIENRV